MTGKIEIAPCESNPIKPVVFDFFDEENLYPGAVFTVLLDKEGTIDHWVLSEINEKMIADFGLTKDRLIHKRLVDLIGDMSDLQTLTQKFNETLRSGRIHRFKMHLSSDRSLLAVVYRIDRNSLGVSITDITLGERKAEEIGRKLELLSNITNSSPSGIFVRDLEGNVILFNNVMAACHPILKEKTGNIHVNEIWQKETAEEILGNEQRVLAQGVTARLEETLMLKGELRTFTALKFPVRDRRGKIYGIGSVITDITEHKRIERALLENEARTKAFLENSATIAWMKDEDGRYIYVSKNYEKQFNKTFESWTGLTDYQLWPKEVAEQFRENDSKVLAGGMPIEVIEETCTLEGKRAWWLNFKFPFEDSSGNKFIGGLGVDISKRVLAEQALREADRHKDEFLAMLSHELRNPLASIRNGLYILDRVTPGGESAKRAKAIIDRQFGQLCHIVDDLLDITRINRNKIELKKEYILLNTLVKRVVDDYRSIFRENDIGLETEFVEGQAQVHGDRVRLAQVVGNLLQNAVKFTDRGGHVQIRLEIDASQQNAIITVADNGVGISPEMIPRLFDPFTQAETTLDRSAGGLGLGLPLVKGLVELHGGEVRALSSGVGRGAEFIVRLPLSFDEAPPMPVEQNTVLPSRSCRVLLIEDNPDVAESLKDAVNLFGHKIVTALNGPDGIEAARIFKPDVLFCDIGLPEMDGYSVAKAFREDESLKNIYLVALTGYALPEDINKALGAGFDLHLAKPPKLQQLEEILARISADRPVERGMP